MSCPRSVARAFLDAVEWVLGGGRSVTGGTGGIAIRPATTDARRSATKMRP